MANTIWGPTDELQYVAGLFTISMLLQRSGVACLIVEAIQREYFQRLATYLDLFM